MSFGFKVTNIILILLLLIMTYIAVHLRIERDEARYEVKAFLEQEDRLKNIESSVSVLYDAVSNDIGSKKSNNMKGR